MRKTILSAAALAALAAAPAHATFVVDASVGGGAIFGIGVETQNFDDLTPLGVPGTSPPAVLPGMSIAFARNSQVASVPNVVSSYAAPFLSGDNGLGFGTSEPDQPIGQNTTPYLAAGGSSSITITFSDDLTYLGLLWGSVDTYNTLELYLDGVLVETITGTAAGGLAGIPASGDQSAGGTIYLNIIASDGSLFDEARFLSGQAAFEFDNFAFARVDNGGGGGEVPAPAALGLFGLALLGLAAARRRR